MKLDQMFDRGFKFCVEHIALGMKAIFMQYCAILAIPSIVVTIIIMTELFSNS